MTLICDSGEGHLYIVGGGRGVVQDMMKCFVTGEVVN